MEEGRFPLSSSRPRPLSLLPSAEHSQGTGPLTRALGCPFLGYAATAWAAALRVAFFLAGAFCPPTRVSRTIGS